MAAKTKYYGKKYLQIISKGLKDVAEKADKWKESKKKQLRDGLLRMQRMAKNVEKRSIREKTRALRNQMEVISWEKPDVGFLYDILFQINHLREDLREELTKQLLNEDAISIIEEPELIENLGQEKGWDFDRFFNALGLVLRSGIIEIQMVKEK